MPVFEYSAASRKIIEHPQYRKIKEQLQAGTSVSAVVGWFDKEGWLGNMSPSTFTQYLYKFKSECADELTKKPEQAESYDAFVGTTIPDVDPIQEIDKLILVQKRRISIDFNTEVNIGKLLESTHKEIKALGELLAIKMNMNGVTDESKVNNTDVGTQLRNLRVNEGEQDKMQELAEKLFTGIKAANNNANKAKKTKIKLKA